MRVLLFVLVACVAMLAAGCGKKKGLGGASPPTAFITTSTTTGTTPLQVTFDASGSIDPDGDTLIFEWDFNGDGVFDLSTGDIPTASHIYTEPGSPTVIVRVSDPLENTATASVGLEVAVGTQDAPVGTLTPDVASGDAPLSVAFSLTSGAPETINLVEVDYDGDGIIDGRAGSVEEANSGIFQYDYVTPGRYQALLRLGNIMGGYSEFTTSIAVSDEGNLPPTVSLAALPASGDAPLETTFTATANDDGSVAKYEWDFNGDGEFEFDSGVTNSASFTFEDGGSHLVAVRVTDNAGLTAKATIRLEVAPGSNLPPVAALDADKRGGEEVPVDITLDASGSVDSDGTIVLYEWDLDGDGTFDEVTTAPTLTYACAWKGETRPRVRVTDNDGASAEAELAGDPISLERGWRITTILTSGNLATDISTGVQQVGSSTFVIASYVQNGRIFFMRANANTPSFWSNHALVTGHTTVSCRIPQIISVGGVPSIAYVQGGLDFTGGTRSAGVKFSRATSSTGLSWNLPTHVSTIATHSLSVAMVRDRPAMVMTQSNPGGNFYKTEPVYVRAANVNGTRWDADTQRKLGEILILNREDLSYHNAKLSVVNGRPAVAYEFRGKAGKLLGDFTSFVSYLRADDSDGGQWNINLLEHPLVSSGNRVGTPIDFILVGDRPAIFSVPDKSGLFDPQADRGFYYERSASVGFNWIEDETQEFKLGNYAGFISSGIRNDRVFVVYSQGGQLRAIRSRTNTGSLWLQPELIESKAGIAGASMTIVNNVPVVVYSVVEQNPFTFQITRRLKVAVWD